MNTEILGVVLQIFLLVAISYPLGKYIAKVYKGEKTWSDFMKPLERLIFKVAGVNPNEEGVADIECFLVCLGNGAVGQSRMAAAES